MTTLDQFDAGPVRRPVGRFSTAVSSASLRMPSASAAREIVRAHGPSAAQKGKKVVAEKEIHISGVGHALGIHNDKTMRKLSS